LGPQSSKDYLEFFNSYNGQFEATLSEYEPYKFLPRKPGYLAQRIMVDPRLIERHGKDTLELILYLTPKEQAEENSLTSYGAETYVEAWKAGRQKENPGEPDKKLFLYDIHFLKASPTILTKSFNALQHLLNLMKQNAQMEILVKGHTDNVGDEAALIQLSEQRASAVKDYLVFHGINPARIRIRGLGATEPIHDNEFESGREKNRRVEIEILKQ
jgi:outer membrane protein OmpA-like peptidoglycan-associated protein